MYSLADPSSVLATPEMDMPSPLVLDILCLARSRYSHSESETLIREFAVVLCVPSTSWPTYLHRSPNDAAVVAFITAAARTIFRS
jgi:hypothetical protein